MSTSHRIEASASRLLVPADVVDYEMLEGEDAVEAACDLELELALVKPRSFQYRRDCRTPKEHRLPLKLLEATLKATGWGVLMAAKSNVTGEEERDKKAPNSHKGVATEQLWAEWEQQGSKYCRSGALIVARGGMLCVDCDSSAMVARMEELFPEEVAAAPLQTTKKGCHFYFRRTPLCAELGIWDAQRMYEDDGSELKIDLKTHYDPQRPGMANHGGLISIAPCPGKAWVRHITPDMPPISERMARYFGERLHAAPKYAGAPPKRPPTSTPAGVPLSKRCIATRLPESRLAALEASAPWAWEDGELPKDCDPALLAMLVRCLDPERYQSYHSALVVCRALRNCGDQFFQPFVTWCRLSKARYLRQCAKGNTCAAKWRSLEPTPDGGRMLSAMAKQDNPDAYTMINSDYVVHKILDDLADDGRADDDAVVAGTAHLVLDGRYVCTSAAKRMWYSCPDNGKWVANEGGSQVIIALLQEVRPMYVEARHRVLEIIKQEKEQAERMREEEEDSDSEDEGQGASVSTGRVKKDERLVVLDNILGALRNASPMCNILKVLAAFMEDNEFEDKLDANPNLLAFENCVRVLRDVPGGEPKGLRPIRPDDYITLTTGYSYYGKGDPAKLQKVLAFMDGLYVSDAVKTYVLRMLAECVHGIKAAETLECWVGFGRNGKGTMTVLCKTAFGHYMYQPDAAVLCTKRKAGGTQTEVLGFKGIRIAIVSEADDMDTQIIKDLTGNDRMQARGCYMTKCCHWDPQHRLVIQTNLALKLEVGDFTTERVRVTDHPHKFTANPVPGTNQRPIDFTLKTWMKDPEYGRAFMHHLLELFDQHDGTYNQPPPEVLSASKEAMDNANLVAEWFNQEYVDTRAEGAWRTMMVGVKEPNATLCTDLWKDFIHEHKDFKEGKGRFYNDMKALGFEKHRTNNGFAYKCMAKSDEEQMAEEEF